MLHIQNYERPQTLEEAYQLRQKKGSAVLGGTGWLRLGEHTLRTAIDLSGLGLRYIREEGEAFSIGTYTTLRDLETDERLNAAFDGAFREAVQAIVGIQFRNCATLGGSVYGRFGFSDVLTLLLSPVLYSIFNERREKKYDDPESLTNQLREYDMRRMAHIDSML